MAAAAGNILKIVRYFDGLGGCVLKETQPFYGSTAKRLYCFGSEGWLAGTCQPDGTGYKPAKEHRLLCVTPDGNFFLSDGYDTDLEPVGEDSLEEAKKIAFTDLVLVGDMMRAGEKASEEYYHTIRGGKPDNESFSSFMNDRCLQRDGHMLIDAICDLRDAIYYKADGKTIAHPGDEADAAADPPSDNGAADHADKDGDAQS